MVKRTSSPRPRHAGRSVLTQTRRPSTPSKPRRRLNPLASWSQAIAAQERREAKAQRQFEREQRQRLRHVDALTLRFVREVDSLLGRVLRKLGYHRRRGELRRLTLRGYRRLKVLAAKWKESVRPMATDVAPGKEPTMSPSTDSQTPSAAAETLREQAETSWITLVAAGDPDREKQLRDELDRRKQDLGSSNASVLERLLVARVALLEVQIAHADLIYAEVQDVTLAQSRFLVLRSAKLEGRLRTMVTALANMRKLLPNRARDHDRDDSRELTPSPRPRRRHDSKLAN